MGGNHRSKPLLRAILSNMSAGLGSIKIRMSYGVAIDTADCTTACAASAFNFTSKSAPAQITILISHASTKGLFSVLWLIFLPKTEQTPRAHNGSNPTPCLTWHEVIFNLAFFSPLAIPSALYDPTEIVQGSWFFKKATAVGIRSSVFGCHKQSTI